MPYISVESLHNLCVNRLLILAANKIVVLGEMYLVRIYTRVLSNCYGGIKPCCTWWQSEHAKLISQTEFSSFLHRVQDQIK